MPSAITPVNPSAESVVLSGLLGHFHGKDGAVRYVFNSVTPAFDTAHTLSSVRRFAMQSRSQGYLQTGVSTNVALGVLFPSAHSKGEGRYPPSLGFFGLKR